VAAPVSPVEPRPSERQVTPGRACCLPYTSHEMRHHHPQYMHLPGTRSRSHPAWLWLTADHGDKSALVDLCVQLSGAGATLRRRESALTTPQLHELPRRPRRSSRRRGAALGRTLTSVTR